MGFRKYGTPAPKVAGELDLQHILARCEQGWATCVTADDKCRWAIMAYGAVKGTDPRTWNNLALTGMYLSAWERHYKRKPRGAAFYPDVRRRLARMIADNNAGDVAAAIDVLFGPELAWVQDKTLDFFTPSNWDKFVVPAVANARKARPSGEQSEFGDRGREPGNRKV